MQISGVSLISNVVGTLRDGLSAAVSGTSVAAPTVAAIGSGDPMNAGSFALPGGYGFADRTVTTTVDDISVKIDVARVVKNGSPTVQNGDVGSGDGAATEAAHIRITTVDDPSSSKKTTIVVDPIVGGAAQLDAAQVAAIERKLQDNTGALVAGVSIDDQRSVTQTVYETSLEKDARGTLQSVRTASTQSSSQRYEDDVRSSTKFDASNGAVGSAADVAASLLAQFTATSWLGANIPGLVISAHA